MRDDIYDLCIVGGGINGAAVARDAADRGLKTILLEAGELGGATSSASSKLAHGGLRYLKTYEFGLVRKALKERDILMRIAPDISWPMRFVIPCKKPSSHKSLQPFWMLAAGVKLYDLLAFDGSLPRSQIVTKLHGTDYGAPLREEFERALVYSDGWIEDHKLVRLNAVSAAQKGAEISVGSPCTALTFKENRWQVTYFDKGAGQKRSINASMVVNATGPWANRFLEQAGLNVPEGRTIKMLKGSHIVLPRAYEGSHAYTIPDEDDPDRVVFAMPYLEGKYTLIGTTQEDFDGDPRDACISDAETRSLLHSFNTTFARQITQDDIIGSFSGVRPTLNDGQASASKVSRDHTIHVHSEYGGRLITLYGGKLTTNRLVAEQITDRVMRQLGRRGQCRTAQEILPSDQQYDWPFLRSERSV